MREIKFRVWDKTHKQFLPLEVYNLHSMTSFNSFGVMRKDWKNYSEGEYFYEGSQVLEQFTGLKDKNGIEIYEGDILSFEDSYATEVSFQEGTFGYMGNFGFISLLETNLSSCVIIGNIHENN